MTRRALDDMIIVLMAPISISSICELPEKKGVSIFNSRASIKVKNNCIFPAPIRRLFDTSLYGWNIKWVVSAMKHMATPAMICETVQA